MKINRTFAALLLTVAAFLGLGVGPAAAHAEQANVGCDAGAKSGGGRVNIGSGHYLTYIGLSKSGTSGGYFNVYVYRNNGTLVFSDSTSATFYIREFPGGSGIFVGTGGYVDFSLRDGQGGVCYDRGNGFV